MTDRRAPRAIGSLVVVVLSLAGGEAMRRAAAFEDSLAAAEEHVATQDAAGAYPIGDDVRVPRFVSWLPVVGPRITTDVGRVRALAAYWRGDYRGAGASEPQGQTVSQPEGEPPDSATRLIAANAAFRALAGKSVKTDALLKSLDGVLKGYVSVLEVDPGSKDAAYNYEFVSRLRSVVAAGRLNRIAPPTSNIHGEQGAPPPETKPDEFNIIVPLRPEERQEQIEPRAGSVPQRKG